MSTDRSARQGMFWRVMVGIATLQLAGLACASLAGYGGRLAWALDLASCFRWQYAVVAVVFAVVFAVLRCRWQLAVAFFLILLNIAPIALLYLPARTAPPPGSTSMRAVVFNVLTNNCDYETKKAYIREQSPDLFLLIETRQECIDAFEQMKDEYPHSIVFPHRFAAGIALYSRFPLENAAIVQLGKDSNPSIRAEVVGPNGRFVVYGSHTPPPINPPVWAIRNEQLRATAAAIKKETLPVVLLGDFNLTPFSPFYQDLLREAKLHDSARGFGLCNTWPVNRRWIRVAIDHFLHSKEIVVTNRTRGPSLGSDHFAIVVDFTMDATI